MKSDTTLTQATIEQALADSISSWWQTPPRLDLAAEAVLKALAEKDAAGRVEEAVR